MPPRRPKFLRVCLAVCILGGCIAGLYALGYHDREPGPARERSGLDRVAVAANARRLNGTLYDPFKGGCSDIGSVMGWIVCADVPRLAYAKAGYDLDVAVKKSTPTGNVERSARRTRDVHAFLSENGWMVLEGAPLLPGDIAFFAKESGGTPMHCALVTEAGQAADARFAESTGRTVFSGEVRLAEILERGWKSVGVGRIVP